MLRRLGVYSKNLRAFTATWEARRAKCSPWTATSLGNREPNSIVNSRQFMSGRKVLNASDAGNYEPAVLGGVRPHAYWWGCRSQAAPVIFAGWRLSQLFFTLKSSRFRRAKTRKLIVPTSRESAVMLRLTRAWIAECAKDLLQETQATLSCLPGLHQTQGAFICLAFAINQALGSIGTCLTYLPTVP